MEHEIWKDIEGYENLYRISNIGRVQRVTSGRILHSYDVHLGYLQVHLCKGGKVKNMFIHRLVATAFIPNPDNLPVVNHKDCNPGNNRADNLEWCTQKYNIHYNGAIEKTIAKRCKPIIQLTLNGEFIKEWDNATIASRTLGISEGSIWYVANHKPFNRHDKFYRIYQAGGYKWEYKEQSKIIK